MQQENQTRNPKNKPIRVIDLLTYEIARLFALDAVEKNTAKNYIDWAMNALQKGAPAKCPEFNIGDIVHLFDGYWGERVEIVLDRNADWNERKFESETGIKIGNMLRKLKAGEAVSDGAEAIESGWDHEHCEICMETISERTENGYRNKHNRWICKRCFTDYYDGISLSFIQEKPESP